MDGLLSSDFHLKLKTEQLAELSFILFFSDALIRLFFNGVLGTNSLSMWLSMLLPYLPLFLICLKNPRRYIKADFVILYIAIIVFFALTLLVHPEYKFHYFRSDYGVWDHVLKPFRGIYAYLFIRLLGDPKKIFKCMRIAGWMMMAYFLYRITQGNWTTVTATGVTSEASYSVTFGYEVLIFALVFLYSALTEKRLSDIIAAVADIVMILIGGSRGPILFIGLFFILFILGGGNDTGRKWLKLVLVALAAGLIYVFYVPLMQAAMRVLDHFHVSSRFIKMMLNGTITSDSNRMTIWKAAMRMIRDNPFGYGAMGSRHVIYKYVYAGYPHSIILEFLIDYGVIVGGILLLGMIGNSISLLFSPRKKEWFGVFLPFFSAACAMLISLTYWSRPEFWSCVAIGVCCRMTTKQNRKNRVRLRI